ncbi:hypothetical protein F5883DRAFT_687855 [Diaporthe sp. PMI_573]|nr:hypothetical protein F5883DRAFT_687855 [Diaporthaceae sp. PMI_573]
MSTSRKTILVLGATGKQGGAVIDSILASPEASSFAIAAVTRDAASSRAQRLAALPNVTVIQGEMSNPEDIFRQAGPVWAVFSVQTNTEAEEQQGKAVVDAAVLNGAQHFVYSSADRGGPQESPKNRTNVKNLIAKYEIEKHLELRAAKSPQNLSYTILRPVTFFENLSADIHGKGFGRMWEQLGNKKLQFISTKDIGWFAAQSIIHIDQYRNVALSLAGDELTQPEADAIFKEATGKPMPLAACPVASAVKFVLKGTVGDLFKWFEEEGYGGDVEACRNANPEIQDFKAWIEENKGRWV